jgi:NAD+ diphosphatase
MTFASTVAFPGIAFGAGGLDRAAHLRRGDGAGAQGPGTLLRLCDGDPLVAEGGAVLWREAVGARPEGAVLLGLEGGRPLWATDAPAGTPAPEGAAWAGLRGIMTQLAPAEAEAAATARALLGWHARHGFCAACGAPTRMTEAGWRRDCPACAASHFPRTDPVVIMLVTRGNAVLLARSPGWPEGMHSLLAGFVEPGETLEAAVRREVREEAGLRVGRVGYLASQPWPFPASLMLGARAEALDRDIALDREEIEAAAWVSRERLMAVFMGCDPAIHAPRPGAIAGAILREWLAGRIAPAP